MTGQPAVSVEHTLVTHGEEVERRLDLLAQVTSATRALSGELRSAADLIALVEFVEAARKPTVQNRVALYGPVEVTFTDVDQDVMDIMTGTKRAAPIDLGQPDYEAPAFGLTGYDVRTVDNNVGDGSDVDTDVWPAAVPPPNYDILDDEVSRAPASCPTCESPDPAKHPAMQFEGEVQPCPDQWHGADSTTSEVSPTEGSSTTNRKDDSA